MVIEHGVNLLYIFSNPQDIKSTRLNLPIIAIFAVGTIYAIKLSSVQVNMDLMVIYNYTSFYNFLRRVILF